MGLLDTIGQGLGGLTAVEDNIQSFARNGQVYLLHGFVTATAATNPALMLWGGSGGVSKNVLIVSATAMSTAGNINYASLRTLSAIDAAIATQTTPVSTKAGGAASVFSGANAAVNLPTGTTQAYSGTVIRTQSVPAQSPFTDLIPRGGFFIPANTANFGIELTAIIGQAGNVSLEMAWAEY